MVFSCGTPWFTLDLQWDILPGLPLEMWFSLVKGKGQFAALTLPPLGGMVLGLRPPPPIPICGLMLSTWWGRVNQGDMFLHESMDRSAHVVFYAVSETCLLDAPFNNPIRSYLRFLSGELPFLECLFKEAMPTYVDCQNRNRRNSDIFCRISITTFPRLGHTIPKQLYGPHGMSVCTKVYVCPCTCVCAHVMERSYMHIQVLKFPLTA